MSVVGPLRKTKGFRTSLFRQANDISIALSSKVTNAANVILLVTELLVGRMSDSSVTLGVRVRRVAGVQALLDIAWVGNVGILKGLGRSARGERIGVSCNDGVVLSAWGTGR